MRKKKSAFGAVDAEDRKVISSGTGPAFPNKIANPSLAKRRTRPSSTVAVFDGQVHVGDVVERADGGDFNAFTSTGELIGTFSTRIEASRAIPIAFARDITAAEADGAAS